MGAPKSHIVWVGDALGALSAIKNDEIKMKRSNFFLSEVMITIVGLADNRHIHSEKLREIK